MGTAEQSALAVKSRLQVPASGCLITPEDKAVMIEAVNSGWLTEGLYTKSFETALQEFTGIKHAMFVNSGSSANLIAVASMVESGRWKPGDLIITVAASFPTTINPLLLYGLVPMFVDIDLETLNANVDQLWRSSCQHKVKGVMLAHTLGNPFDCERIRDICQQRKLGLVEDCCDALGATFNGAHVGSFGEFATCSFFPAHHITSGGEGGAVFTNDEELAAIARSIRDWGRDCYCAPGQENTCGNRFGWKSDLLPLGYDHKYVFTNLGFNLKASEVQAACGASQIGRLPAVVSQRNRNFQRLTQRFPGSAKYQTVRECDGCSGPSWFGFPLVLKEEGIRPQLQGYLSQEGVGSRLVFSGNITKQPYFAGRRYLVSAELRNTDQVMNNAFWIGCHPELTDEQLDYSATKILTFLGEEGF